MSYTATAEGFPPSTTSAPRVTALQRALVWLVGASGAIVFIEPSPYELITLTASVIFFATGLRLRLVFMPLLLLLFLLNVGYTIGAIPFLDKSEVANWIATSWYMAVTVMFFAMVLSDDATARLDMLRRGLIVGAMIASIAGIAGYFNLIPGGVWCEPSAGTCVPSGSATVRVIPRLLPPPAGSAGSCRPTAATTPRGHNRAAAARRGCWGFPTRPSSR